MGFDQYEPGPIVNVRKKTTKVNLWIIIGVLAFLAAGAAAIWYYLHQEAAGAL